jgi:hypothetical protein
LEAERAGLIESLSGDESGCLGEVVEGCVVGAFSSAEFGRAGWALDLGDGVAVTSDSTLRFRSRDEVASLLASDYRVLDVRDAPDRPGREYVFIAERTT